MSASPLAAARDTNAADWIVASLRTFAESVTSLVPDGLPAYVRVFHPAYLEQQPVRWSDIAAANGTQPHPGMQLGGLNGTGPFHYKGQPGIYDHRPAEGSLPSELRRPLVDVLPRHTATPERCWFAVWYGFGAAFRDDLVGAPTFRTPGREYHLFSGAVESISDRLWTDSWTQSANIWWPDDRAWCVASEIDLITTYIGCSEACRDDLVAIPDLEAMGIDPTTGIDWYSDHVNPKPPRSDSVA